MDAATQRYQGVRGTPSVENVLAKYFGDVEVCRLLMKKHSVLAFGAVLSSTRSAQDNWKSEFGLYAHRPSLGKEGLSEWDKYLFAQGYSAVAEVGDSCDEVVSALQKKIVDSD